MRYALLLLLSLPLAACGTFQTDIERGQMQDERWKAGDTGVAFLTPDIRVITQRKHPVLGNTIVCTQPSPDVAKALSTAVQGSASGGNGAVNAGVGFGAGSSEAVAELAGRSTALLGLRESLYYACEAYANGIIGANAYALVLSRYSQLMSTLFIGQDIAQAAAAGASAPAAALSPGAITINVPAPPAPPAPAKSSTGGGTADSGKSDKTSALEPQTSAATAKVSFTPRTVTTDALKLIAADVAGAGGGARPAAAGGAAGGAGGATNSAAATDPVKDPAKDQSKDTPNTAPPLSNAAAVASNLTRVNEDYLNLDYDLVGILAVACVNENDPTRMRYAKGITLQNAWLNTLCSEAGLEYANKLFKADQEQFAALAKVAPPVNPMGVAAAAETPQKPQQAVATSQAATVAHSADFVKVLQKALQDKGLYKDTVDGLYGKNTADAVGKYINPPK